MQQGVRTGNRDVSFAPSTQVSRLRIKETSILLLLWFYFTAVVMEFNNKALSGNRRERGTTSELESSSQPGAGEKRRQEHERTPSAADWLAGKQRGCI